MDAKFNWFNSFFSKFIPYPNLENKGVIVEWKNRLLFFTLGGLLVLGTIAYIPSIILSIQNKLWVIAFADTMVLISVFIIALSKKITANKKVLATILIFYFLGIVLIIFLGKDGAGFNWLFLFPILSGFFYGFRGALKATIVNILTLTLISIVLFFKPNMELMISQYNFSDWIVNSINFITISTLISFSLAVIISSIDNSLKKEMELSRLLKENQEKLAVEKLRAEESDRLKSTFLANMSHEIRTPMNAILGFSGLLTDPNISSEEKIKFNRLIQISGEQLVHIIDDIIDI
jgi:signal transduction histidine kinase